MSNNKIKCILSKSYLTISDIDVLFNFLELSTNIDETKQIILDIYLTEDILECDCNINSIKDLDRAWFKTKSIINRFNIREGLENNSTINFKNPYEDYLTRLRHKIATINDIDIKLILNNSDYISYDELCLIYGDLLSIDTLSNIAIERSSKLKFYFQINEDRLAVDFLGNKDEAFLNDVLKGVSTFDKWIHYVAILEPFLNYENDNFNGYIQAISIRLENGYRAVSKGKFNSIFIDRLLFKKDEMIEYLSSIEIFPKHTEIKSHIKTMTKKSNQPKPATNQDNNYIYSEALKPYNDIILAFDSEYQRLSNDNIRIQSTNHIQPWLKENYKDLKDHDIRVLNNLIQTHYKLKK
ncbi:hypothetical protein LA02_270 [Francisella philomiragia]|uniref:hypothetical protein n=1 Tax=Francisella philomiragia TaxID=28110 RepID=UPI0005A576BE|nr:hypothetical protein [Francisella philomiragia]AJI58014.1 hypothetical protein LA02_270 [Francisella philomiragia]